MGDDDDKTTGSGPYKFSGLKDDWPTLLRKIDAKATTFDIVTAVNNIGRAMLLR